MASGLVPSWSLGEAEMTDATAFCQRSIPTPLVHCVRMSVQESRGKQSSLVTQATGAACRLEHCCADQDWVGQAGLVGPHFPPVSLHEVCLWQGNYSHPILPLE